MPKQDEINFLLEQIKLFEQDLVRQETMSERVEVRKDIIKLKQKVNELVKQLDETNMYHDFSN